MSGAAPRESVYQLKITLLETEPPIRRTVQVAADTDLRTLHSVIQRAMGWEDAHLYEFASRDASYGEADGEALSWSPDLEPARKARLDRLLRKRGDRLTYLYDFGDSWEHEVKLEKVLTAEPRATYPRCIAAERACPPEDCGGVPGYELLLEALAHPAHPAHPDHEEMREWIGGDFDPDYVDVDLINRRLELT